MLLSVAPLIRRQPPTVRCTLLCRPRFRLWLRIDLRPRQTLPVCTANGCRRMMRSGSPVKLLVHCWRTKRPKTQKVVQLFSFFLDDQFTFGNSISKIFWWVPSVLGYQWQQSLACMVGPTLLSYRWTFSWILVVLFWCLVTETFSVPYVKSQPEAIKIMKFSRYQIWNFSQLSTSTTDVLTYLVLTMCVSEDFFTFNEA